MRCKSNIKPCKVRSVPAVRAMLPCTQPAPLTLTEIQSRVLDSDSVLLEYALGREAQLFMGNHG